jgi:serine/threonine protein kinase
MSGDPDRDTNTGAENVNLGPRFIYQKKLGHGAYGTVYQAIDKKL